MARGRAQLSEKQERILIQCQLMGLTTKDMTQISNRLKSLDKEREFKVRVDEVTAGVTWKQNSKGHYLITTKDGFLYECILKKVLGQSPWEKKDQWTIKVSHPGTRMKEKIFNKENLYYTEYHEVVSACPNKDKRLFRLLNSIYKGRWR